MLLLVRLRNSVIEHIVEAQRTRERDGKQLYHIIKPTGPTSYSTGTHAHWAAEIFWVLKKSNSRKEFGPQSEWNLILRVIQATYAQYGKLWIQFVVGKI